MLKHNTAIAAGAIHLFAIYQHLALRRFVDTLQNAEKCGFSAAACTDNADEFAVIDRKADIFQGREVLLFLDIIYGQISDFYFTRTH